MEDNESKGVEKKRNLFVKALKISGWTLLSVVGLVCILLLCAVKYIDSDRFAPMIEDLANDYVDGHVKIGKLKLGFHPHFPILGIEVEDLSVVSHAFNSLSAKQKGLLPNYADSLLTLDYLAGSLNIKRLLIDDELSLHNVVLRGLGVNLVIAHDGTANYDIIKIPADSTESKSKIPGIRLDRFALDHPKEIRFYNAADSTSASVLLLTDAAVDGREQPTYRLKISGNVTSPKAAIVTNLEQISFGLNGKLYWNPENPELVAIDQMELQGAFIKAIATAELDLKSDPILRKVNVDLMPVALSDLLTLLPDSIRQEHRLYPPYFSTNANVKGRFELLKPMNLATDTIPTARIDISMPPSILKYGNAKLRDIGFEVSVNTFTNLPDRTVVDLQRFSIAGPGTKLQASAFISTPVSDPSFDAKVEGNLDFEDLPPIIKEKISGYLAGKISADVKAKGSVSMLDVNHLQSLVADGTVTANNVYFLTADTSKMVEIGKAKIDFDSNRIVDNLPLLNARLAVDTATILVSGVDLALGAISLNASSKMPITGDLKVGRFNIIALKDSAGARIRNIGGKVKLQEAKNAGKIPEILADLLIGKVSAGTLSDRVILSDTKVKASLLKMPSNSQKKQMQKKKPAYHREMSYIPPAKVYKYVYESRMHRKRIRRVYGDVDADDEEVLVWNLTEQFSRFLNEWKLKGSVNTRNAHLLTPFFPLRNKISTVDLKFNNDTVNISNITLRAGKSDLALSGLVTNVRRAMTAKTDNNLKGNFSLLSDTIDINELSATVFTGASYASDRRHGKVSKFSTADDKSLQARLDALSKRGPGRSSPVLIPVNIDAQLNIQANHLLYGDFDLQNMGGDLLLYDGAVNIHNIKADSDAGNVTVSALYSAPKVENMHIGFGLEVNNFNISKFVSLVPAIDSITPLMHDFSGTIGADIAATCRIDSGMNLSLPSLNAAIRITGDNLAFIDPKKYRTLGKWLGFKDKSDNTIHKLNVEMTVEDGLLRVYPFAFNIDRYRLGVYGYNNFDMDFDYHLSVLKSPIPFKFGVTIKGNPKKYKVKFGGARFNENTVIESTNIVNKARINLIDEIESVFKRGVQHSRFARLQVAQPSGFDLLPDSELSPADSLTLLKEGLILP